MDFDLDHHKLAYHPEAVAAWQRGEDIYPLYVEFSPVGSCNHRCVFCAYDYLGYQKRQLHTEGTVDAISAMAKGGTKAVLFAGEGEPLLHPDLSVLAMAASTAGMQVGVFSNGTLLRETKAETLLPWLTFIRFSVNAGDAATYAKVHQVAEAQFNIAMANIDNAVAMKRRDNMKVTLGVQMVLLKDNISTVTLLCKRMQDAGVDYLTLKPFVQHPDQGMKADTLKLEDIDALLTEAESFSTPSFRVVARRDSFSKYGKRGYSRCLGLPFFAFVLSDGSVYTCGPYYGNMDHCYGNIHAQPFDDIWRGKRRRDILDRVEKGDFDCGKCMSNCRPDEVNRYLWKLRNPPEHVGFI